MGRALLRVHIARCGNNREMISAKDECLMLLEKAFSMEPRLCYEGIGVDDGTGNRAFRGRKFIESQDRLESEFEQLIACEEWLVPQHRKRAINKKFSSYKLKHIVEHTKNKHVSNGALCAMAIGLEFKYEVDGPNIYINISNDLYDYDGTPTA
ncbi:MAG: hypothetical protein EBR82_07385 [Caulobacteraceae bacterium]|nr:hypothetical protein [Caulobacteraceae bacterium]